MTQTLIHQIDPVIGTMAGVHMWWYGLSYALGFLEMHLWLRRCRGRLGLTLSQVYSLSLFFAVGVLLGGRCVEVLLYEWPFYSTHPALIPAFWLGGMATHGLMAGAVVATWLFCRLHGKSFLAVVDEMVIPGALLLGLGRVGNFIDGQIVGAVTGVAWGVQFPDAEGFRHPVVLYDGIKNLLLVPWLLWIRSRRMSAGAVAAQFVFWYSFLRLGVDLFREYPTTLLGLATGQSLNIAMAIAGAVWCVLLRLSSSSSSSSSYSNGRERPSTRTRDEDEYECHRLGMRRLALAAVLVFSIAIPSDWTQDVPERYGRRHPGLTHSLLYPAIHSEALPDAGVKVTPVEDCPWRVPPSDLDFDVWVEIS